MTKTKLWCLYLVAIIIVAGLILSLKPTTALQPTGIVLPLAQARVPLATDNVQLLQSMPTSYQGLALINVELHSLKQSKKLVREIANYAKMLAAKQGANGLLVSAFGYEPPSASDPAPLAKYIFRGQAIYINNRD